jgi:hypothetical protein
MELTRREAIGIGGAVIAGALAVPAAAQARTHANVLRFNSRPDLSPPAIAVSGRTTGDPAYFLLTASGYPVAGPGEPGLMILDRTGEIVWYSPNTAFPETKSMGRTNLQVQTYRGRPVLTWWEGKVNLGIGFGQTVIADQSYRVIATVRGGNGMSADLHDFVITPRDTALITAVRPRAASLSALHGPAKGTALSGVVLEVDIASGKVLAQWDSLDHVPVTDTYLPFFGGSKAIPFDYFHINSIAIAPDGDLIISARNTSTVYKIAWPSGQVRWRLGGKRSNFQLGPGATFWFQHHAQPLGGTTMSIFDDGGVPQKEPQSRGILLDVDTTAMRATLLRAYTHRTRQLAANQGSMQVLPDGRVLVGWGNLSSFTEFAADGTTLVEGTFPAGDQSYRAFTANWTGFPTDKPSIAARAAGAGRSVVYASWNGATQLAGWTVLAGGSPSRLRPAGSRSRAGFETAIAVRSGGPYFAVVANDAHGRRLAQSATVKV